MAVVLTVNAVTCSIEVMLTPRYTWATFFFTLMERNTFRWYLFTVIREYKVFFVTHHG
jgi:hypothetical protein